MPQLVRDESQMSRRLLGRAPDILKLVDESFIIQQRGFRPRPMPVFRAEEISLGKVLGMGGFGIVNEITKFTLDDDYPTTTTTLATAATSAAPEEKRLETTAEEETSDRDDDEEQQEDDGESEEQQQQQQQQHQEQDDGDESEEKERQLMKTIQQQSVRSDLSEDLAAEDEVHYDILKARHVMERRAVRKDVSRYALKRLHACLSELEQARGMIDMAVEAKYLAVVWHPNIIKMRGMATGPLVDKDFFIILDRLFGTLDEKINEWHKVERQNSGKLLGVIGKRRHVLKELLVDRMTVAYDLAAAFFYLHENRLVYRDIKPENIGFDIRGDVKVFDFGLCKSLSPKLKAREGYGYRLTGRAGSLPYMAPEVIKMETYDTKCDVYSFAILLWEILSLKQAFKGTSPTCFVEKVVVNNERLPVPKTFPPLTRLMLPEAWDKDPRRRPDMKRVAILIRGDLNDMTTDQRILRRTKHMEDRSHHSFDGDEEALARVWPPHHHAENPE